MTLKVKLVNCVKQFYKLLLNYLFVGFKIFLDFNNGKERLKRKETFN